MIDALRHCRGAYAAMAGAWGGEAGRKVYQEHLDELKSQLDPHYQTARMNQALVEGGIQVEYMDD